MSASSLASLGVGETAEITHVGGGGAMALRLLEMGLTPGARISVVKRAPLGDPIELSVRGYHVSLRISEASRVEVSALG